jgi:flavin-dependent dehydrogenase
MGLHRAGLDVVVLERAPDPPPAEAVDAWADWERRAVAQFRQAHILLPRGRQVLEQNLPEVLTRLGEGGGVEWNGVAVRPPTIPDWIDEPDDARFDTVTARRPVIDWAFSHVAAESGVDIVRGAVVESPLFGDASNGTPHVSGVRTAEGDEINAAIVIDASGRRTALPQMLNDGAGCGPVEHKEDSGFVYYTRFYQSEDGSMPQPMSGLLSPIGSISLLILPGDHGTWSITIYGSSADAQLRAVRDPEVFDRVIAGCPLHAQWLGGTAITDVATMSSVVDRRYDYHPAGNPVVTGFLAVGDAWACTNPSVGRGISMGISHAVEAVSVVPGHLDDPAALARAFWSATEQNHQPWHDATLANDRLRVADIETFRAGGTARTDPDDLVQVVSSALPVAGTQSAEVFRGFIEVTAALTLPSDLVARPGFLDKVLELAGGVDPPQVPGPDRRELVELLS